jgi:hypothetical protein
VVVVRGGVTIGVVMQGGRRLVVWWCRRTSPLVLMWGGRHGSWDDGVGCRRDSQGGGQSSWFMGWWCRRSLPFMRWWVRALVAIGEVVVEGGRCRLLVVVLLGIRSWVLVWPCCCGPLLPFVRHATGCSLVVVHCCCHIDNEGRLVSSFICLVATSLLATWYRDFESVDGGGELCLPGPTITHVSSWALAIIRELWGSVWGSSSSFGWSSLFVGGCLRFLGGCGSLLASWVVLWLSSVALLGWCGGGWLKK